MSVVQRIRAIVKDDIITKRPADIYRVTEMLKLEYPEHSLEEIAAMVSEVVISLAGDRT